MAIGIFGAGDIMLIQLENAKKIASYIQNQLQEDVSKRQTSPDLAKRIYKSYN